MQGKNWRKAGAFAGLLAGLGGTALWLERRATVEAATVQAPRFEVDPMWPKPLPNHWVMGNVIGLGVDSRDHVWIVHRAASLERMELYATTKPPSATCCAPAPPVLEFDPEGNLVGHWGGPGQGYEWPESNHGIFVDHKGNVWIGGNGRGGPASAAAGSSPRPTAEAKPPASGGGYTAGGGYYHDCMILKFSREGKFIMQIGKAGQSKGSNDVENVKGAAKLFVDPKTNELIVADGYGNRRVIVFDADTGKYKRHWGAYGKKPDDAPMPRYNPADPPAQQFRNPVHCAELAKDGMLYVCDRPNDRIQVFKADGTFVKEAFIEKNTLGDGSVWDIAFSKDPQQKYIYLADGANEKIHVILRETLEVLTTFGDGGRQPGQFYAIHSIATDTKGNIYTTETYRGQRLQKFNYRGMAAVTKKDQGVVWHSRSFTLL
jgi:DNA-binding beta-propeller fold protein YncE